MGKVLVVGSINMDIVMQVDELPRPGETIFGSNVEYLPGGKGSNQAASVGRLGIPVSMIGAVGRDDNGAALINSLKESGVDTSAILTLDDFNTGIAAITVNNNGENNIIVLSGANREVTIDVVKKFESIIDECSIVLLQNEIPMQTVQFTAKLAKQKGKTVIFNPAPSPGKLSDELIENIDILTPNETELENMSGLTVTDVESAELAARKLIKAGIKSVVVTMGKLGALVVTEENSKLLPGYNYAPVVDTTAAGDCFNAALAVKISQNASLEESVKFANLAAAISVTRKGAQPSLPWKDEVDKAVQQYIK